MGLALLAAGLAVRLAAVLHHAVNTDEPQHLHVAWAWTRGWLPYRDVFDNHMPLFSLLLSPILAFAGERADIVVVMRLAMIPLVLVTLAATWLVARRLFSTRAALWAVALVAVNPEFLRGSVEYRTDQLWTTCWIGALAVLVAGRFSAARAFAAGLLLGAAFGVSAKTSLLLACLGLAGVFVLVRLARLGFPLGARRLASRAATLLAGLVIVPGAFAAYFALRGAWAPMLYGVVGHNMVPGLGLWHTAPWRPVLLVVAAIPLAMIAGALVRSAPTPGLGARRALLLLATGLAHAGIELVWPLVTRADLLPLLPIEAAFGAALLLALPHAAARLAPRARRLARALAGAPALLVTLETVASATIEPVWQNHTRAESAVLAQVLRLTRPGEPVMDVKGEAIFRARPCYPAIETITEARYRLGLLRDDIPERLIATGTAVVVRNPGDPFPLPPRALAFVDANYLPFGSLCVLGVRLSPGAGGASDPRAFTIAVPQRYALVTTAGPAHGRLDGTPYAGARALARGRHVYVPAPGEGAVTALWAEALERGVSPAPRDPAPGRIEPRGPGGDGAAAVGAERVITVNARDRVLVIAPHPDDESLATGGLLLAATAAGAQVRVVYATDGEFNPWAQLVVEGRWPFTAAARARWGALRRRESLRALAELGVPAGCVEWLELPDQHLTDLLAGADGRLTAALAREIRRDRPTLIAAPSAFDRHPDHSAVAVSLAFALARLGADGPRPRVIEYRVHRGRTDPEPTLALPLAPEARARKRAAILCHASQLRWHRRQMLAVAREREGFDEFGATAREPHPIVGAALEGSILRVEIAGARAWGLGALTLRIAVEGDPGARMAITLPGRPGTIEVRDAARGGAPSRARIESTARGWHVRLALAGPPPALCFVKLERPRERALGFFDDAGWMRARTVTAPREAAPAAVRSRKVPSAASRS